MELGRPVHGGFIILSENVWRKIAISGINLAMGFSNIYPHLTLAPVIESESEMFLDFKHSRP